MVSRRAASLERLDLDLWEFHHALVVGDALVVLVAKAMLKADPPARKFGVGSAIHCLLPVQDYREGLTFRRDLVDVPLSGGLRHRIDLGEVDDPARPLARRRAGV